MLEINLKSISHERIKHPRWSELHWAVGYIDAHGAVHGKLLFTEDSSESITHGELFPQVSYKTWRWSKSEGMMKTQTVVDLDDDDWEAVRNWLLKNGCLNDWEL